MTLEKNLKTLNELSQLEDEWYGEGQGTPISKKTIEKTEKILKDLGDYQPWIYPTVDGNIQMEYDGTKTGEYLEFVISEDKIEVFCQIYDKITEKDDIEPSEILKMIESFYEEAK